MEKPQHIVIIKDHESVPSREYVRMRTECPSEPSITYAVHHSIVRQCRLLDVALDESDLQVSGASDPQPAMGEITAVIPDCSRETAELVFKYLELTSARIPTILSRPLKAPLEELIQPWEREFLWDCCLENRDAARHRPLLNVMRTAEFLVVDSLRDLCCAFLASLVLKCTSEAEVLRVAGLQRAATQEELQPIFELYPFLKTKSTHHSR